MKSINKRVVFVGLSNKINQEPFDIATNSGKIINEIIDKLNCECYKINLVPYAPVDELGKLRYPNKKELKEGLLLLEIELDKINPTCIVGLGNIVHKNLKKLDKYKNILLLKKHPSYIYVYKRKELDDYINDIILNIKRMI